MPARALPAARQGLARRLGRGIQSVAAIGFIRLLRWSELARQRRALLALNEHMLKDIGVSRAAAEREASRPFWSDGIDRWSDPRR
jgi:uncharacterized protein YjiS (DUF1127 family)